MFLKNLSTNDLNFSTSCSTGLKKIKAMSKFDRYMTIIWLLGPFIYLIERDPADLWLTSIGIIFIFRCFKEQNWRWASQLWFRLAFTLWIYGMLIALMSDYALYSFLEGFKWIRFPIYVAAAQVWLAKDRDIRIMMLVALIFGMLTMLIILTTELLIINQTNGRLTWPYGDTIPGTYLGKFCLPLICVLSALAISQKSKVGLLSGLILSCTTILCLFTGERMSFIIIVCGGFLAALSWKPKLKNFLFVIFFLITTLSTVMILNPSISDRFTKHFFQSVPIINTHANSGHWGAWRGGIHQFIINPIIGVGPSVTRKTCGNLPSEEPTWLPGKNYCGNHPHNFYIQLFAETGFIGLLLGFSMFFEIVKICYKNRYIENKCPMSSTAFVIPLALFFPLQQFGNFYGQWGNLFLWFAVGFAVSQIQELKEIKN